MLLLFFLPSVSLTETFLVLSLFYLYSFGVSNNLQQHTKQHASDQKERQKKYQDFLFDTFIDGSSSTELHKTL